MLITSNPCKVRHAVLKEKKPIAGARQAFDEAVILFDEVIKIRDLPQLTTVGNESCFFEFRERGWR